MAVWNPWRGCHKTSDGCKFCYIHKGDLKRGIDTNIITKTNNFYAPINKDKKGNYQIKPGQTVYLCFTTDFLIEEADEWRSDCWKMIKERPDLTFLFLTKRISRFLDCLPLDWNEGYDNVHVGCSIENQAMADLKLAFFNKLPIKHKIIVCQPLIEKIDLSAFLTGVELVTVGGESDQNARILNYDWVLDIRQQCIDNNISFVFRQCGSNFIKDGKLYKLNVKQLGSQARKADIDYLRR